MSRSLFRFPRALCCRVFSWPMRNASVTLPGSGEASLRCPSFTLVHRVPLFSSFRPLPPRSSSLHRTHGSPSLAHLTPLLISRHPRSGTRNLRIRLCRRASSRVALVANSTSATAGFVFFPISGQECGVKFARDLGSRRARDAPSLHSRVFLWDAILSSCHSATPRGHRVIDGPINFTVNVACD